MLIHSLYGLKPPTKKEQSIREKKVAEVIKKMGDTYLLAKPIKKQSIGMEFVYVPATTY
jgi:hypothetical protein